MAQYSSKIIKAGALIGDTKTLLSHWDVEASVTANVKRVQRDNVFGKVCELIFRYLLPTEEPGASQFRDFLRDERQMRILFENFVRNFYKHHTSFRVKREDIYWRWIAADEVARGLLPKNADRYQSDFSNT